MPEPNSMMLLGSGIVPVVLVVLVVVVVPSQNRERFRRNRSDRVLRSRRRTGVLVPVNRVASVAVLAFCRFSQ